MNGWDRLLHVLCGYLDRAEQICSSEIFSSHSALSFTLCPDVGCISKETGSNIIFWTCEWSVTGRHDCMPGAASLDHNCDGDSSWTCGPNLFTSSLLYCVFFEQFCCVRSHTFSLQFPISESDKLPFHIMKILAQQTVLLIHKLLNFPAFEAAKRWKSLW